MLLALVASSPASAATKIDLSLRSLSTASWQSAHAIDASVKSNRTIKGKGKLTATLKAPTGVAAGTASTTIPALKKNKTKRLRITTLATPFAPGKYALKVCAKAPRKYKDSKPRNNCRTTTLTITPAIVITPMPSPTAAPSATATPAPAAPDTTITLAPAANVDSSTASFTYAAIPAATGTTFECRLDAAAFAACPANGISYSSLADGEHTFAVRAISPQGLPDATPATHTWTITSQIGSVRAMPDGPASAPLTDVVVTYLKPQIGADAAGFYVQVAKPGPALFVSVDPATLAPAPAVGDRVSFRVTNMGSLGGQRMATSISSFSRLSNGFDVTVLTQEASGLTDLVSEIDGYESELISIEATISGTFVSAGADYRRAAITTTGYPGGDLSLQLRLPAALVDRWELVPGCQISIVETPLWRNGTFAQVTASVAADIALVKNCPAPRILTAESFGNTAVVVSFDRRLNADSVRTNGRDFHIEGPDGETITVSSAFVNANKRLVSLSTSAQVSDGVHTVYLGANDIHDELGTRMDEVYSEAVFTGG